MKELEKFAGKNMPYNESEDYVAQLIERSANRAIKTAASAPKRGKVLRWTLEAISAAAVLLIGVLSFVDLNRESDFEKIQNSMTLSEVLNSMSEEELMSVNCYVIEDIPEYE